ncbi:protein-glutamine gamma-glutamyltransferase [Anoxybacillus voinovskiensis]|uniref:Protein-glutamine gamma-glutamyltransferase n=1 Tax=Anoxybacteroides voinovskiense TaxID=230470 RepID=A0A840DR55_9BACL|nr:MULTISPECIES: protein-glutamine gamma-glutamyltransferase [Anoxybacillus]MBB4075611.1 protein-glutamine gamma-glutamyltransferase [Anoxybacillus voinovskiensis]MCL6585155.1 protein-glutamine gamma-glutamyltransferase [Anoxybacillus sp.]GGJ80410.1 protein-glutamine gamma-glutamyltransferase [Anoxybacillus voinovskiensis]
MIQIQHTVVDDSFFSSATLSKEQQMVFQTLVKEKQMYSYESKQQLQFELVVRERILQTSVELAKSAARFTIFQFSKCNERYWQRNRLGGFELKKGVAPSAAINDIFINSQLYAFECATAIVIIFYKAVLDTIKQEIFDKLFDDLLLYDWHVDKDLNITTKKGDDYIPGDCLYFKNPDVDPSMPQWQGENTIYLGNGLYYGHGIGIKSKEEVIAALNKRRKPAAKKSAYLLAQTTRIDFRYLSTFVRSIGQPQLSVERSKMGIGSIGSSTFLYR